MSNFTVIEGDNGSGKSTLAQSLKALGFNFVSEDDSLEQMKVAAKKLRGLEKVQAFYQYNMHTAQKALQVKNSKPPVVVRYWVSTLAAAYADEIIDFEELKVHCAENVKKFSLPTMFFYLKCNYGERMKRIAERQKIFGIADDSRDKKRSERYRRAVMEISFAVPTTWIFIPADEWDCAAVKENVINFLNKI